jgi:hypothetical protein
MNTLDHISLWRSWANLNTGRANPAAVWNGRIESLLRRLERKPFTPLLATQARRLYRLIKWGLS